MTPDVRRLALPTVTLAAMAIAASLGVCRADPPDFDHVVLLANENVAGGYNDVWGFVGSDGREYVIQGHSTGTLWWDVDDPVHPVLVASLSEPASPWRDMFVIGDHAFVSAENFEMGIRVYDISDPTDPTHVASYLTTVNQAHNVFGDPARDLVFAVGGSSGGANGGLQILDASDPLNMTQIGLWNDHYVHDVSIHGNLAFLCLIYLDRLQILDLTDPTNPVELGGYDDPVGNVHASWPTDDGQHVLITHETQGGHLRAIDVANPMAPTLAGIWAPAPMASAHNVHVEGSLAYVSWYNRGTRVIDVSDPANLDEVGYWDTSSGTGLTDGNWGVYPHLPSGIVASNDRQNGLFLFRYDPDAGVLDGAVTSSAGSFGIPAQIEYVNLDQIQIVDSTGTYRFSAFPGPSHELRFTAFGHAPDSADVSLAPDGVTTTNVTLQKLPAGGLHGTVTSATARGPGQGGSPLAGTEAILRGTPLVAITDATGEWSLPDVPVGTYELEIRSAGYASTVLPVTVTELTITEVETSLLPATLYEDFSAPVGWTEDNDPTVVGTWTFSDPVGTFLDGEPFQPEDDHTQDPETDCAVTGNFTDGVDDADVDDGATRLLSPVYDLSGLGEPHLVYWRWFATETPQDPWVVEVGDGAGTIWVLLESSTADERFWKSFDHDLTGRLPDPSSVRFRFTAQDQPPEQLLEAALDDFTIYDGGGASFTPPPPADLSPELHLAAPSPNPSAGAARLRFSLPSAGHVSLRVHDVRGARVATLVNGRLPAGPHETHWDGRADDGSLAAPGVYFVELRAEESRLSRKLIRGNVARF